MNQHERIDEIEAQDRLAELSERAYAGEEFVVTRSGQPFAKIVCGKDATLEQLWNDEHSFWTGEATFYETRLADICLIVFPPPTGILQRDAIIDTLSQAPRCLSVSFFEQAFATPASNVRLLAYRASADRNGAHYECYCSSTYLLDGEHWLLAHHQQTPV